MNNHKRFSFRMGMAAMCFLLISIVMGVAFAMAQSVPPAMMAENGLTNTMNPTDKMAMGADSDSLHRTRRRKGKAGGMPFDGMKGNMRNTPRPREGVAGVMNPHDMRNSETLMPPLTAVGKHMMLITMMLLSLGMMTITWLRKPK